MIPTMTATTAATIPIAKPALAPDDLCLAEPWDDVDVAVGDVVDDVNGLPPYGQ